MHLGASILERLPVTAISEPEAREQAADVGGGFSGSPVPCQKRCWGSQLSRLQLCLSRGFLESLGFHVMMIATRTELPCAGHSSGPASYILTLILTSALESKHGRIVF